NGQYAFENASDWTGKLSRLSGPDLATYQDYVTGLPRAIRDHLNNQPSFGPDGKLYFAQGSNSSMGQADSAWGLRAEHLLNAAVLQVDTAAITARIAAGKGPLDVRTEGSSTGNYNPWAADAAVKIYATGVRNAYDLVWTRAGNLYAPTNGSAAGGAAPSVAAGTYSGTRIDTAANGPFTTPAITGISNIAVSEDDFLFKIQQGGYYGHPNPSRGEYAANGGNPTDGVDYEEFSQYPTGTLPDRNYRGAAYVFGKNHSPDGAIEYTGTAFGGRLDGKLLVTRYSGGGDIVAMTLDADGNVTESKSGIAGLSGFANPLDLTEDAGNGNLYIVDYGAQKIYLARPIAPGAKITVDTTTLRFSDDYANSNTTTSPTRIVRVTNTGTAPLAIPATGLTLSNTANWVITSQPTLPATIGAGESVEVGIAFRATAATGAGIKTATLTIASSDPSNPTVTVNLRGLAAVGTGGMNEPSLQRVLDLYGIGVKTGDANPANTNLQSNAEPRSADNDEVVAQRFVKAGAGSVTIEPLAAYAGGSPSVKFGYYPAGTADARTELLTVPGSDVQSVNPGISGTTTFDPGTSRFGLYAYFPIFTNYAYSEDSLNTKETTPALRRKIRYFPLKDASGVTVPNAYIFTSEDYNNDTTGGTDANDFVAIIRNVTPANDGPEVGLENTDGTPFPDRLVFSRVQNPTPDKKKDASGNLTIQPPNNVEHDTAVLRVRNTGGDPLVINTIGVSNASAWTIVNPPAVGTAIEAGGFLDVTVKFVAQTKPPYPGFNPTPDPSGYAANNAGFYNGTLTIGTTDADEPTTTVQLAGWWQTKSEDNQEPSLPVLANNLFGYTTKILNTGQSMFTLDGSATTIGEEVLSKYWVRADASSPVTVKQLAAYHSQGDSAVVRWHPYASTALTAVAAHAGTDGQSVLPHLNGSSALATGSFKPFTASTNPLAAFGFKIDGEWSDDAKNAAVAGNPNDKGHHVRFFPARDQAGNVIPNTWLMGMDYLGINYDYQDNLYLVENMRPMPPATPAAPTAAGQPNGVAVNWTATTGAPLLAGYNVYRSTSTTGTFAKLNADPVTPATYVDTAAANGITYYYRVTAVDSWGGESATSSVVSAARAADNVPPAPPTGLAAAGVGNGVSVTWAAVGDADLAGYRVYRAASAGGTFAVVSGSALVTATTLTDATASPGTAYAYKVTAVDFSGNESTASDVATATAGDSIAPAAPTATAAASADVGIRVSWLAPADPDVAGYRVYRSANADGSAASLVSGTALAGGTAYTDTTALAGQTWYYVVTAVDASNNESGQSAPAGATRVAVALPTVRIDVGSAAAFTDAAGQVWAADQYVTGGTASTGAYEVAGTADDPLYYTRRFGAFTYAIPVPNGQYTLNLHFADSLYTTAGKRIFDVKVEGTTALSNFDIAAQGGGKTKLVKSIPITLTDGVLNIQTVIKTENPLLSGIELIPVNTTPTSPPPTDPGTGTGDTTPPAVPGGVAAAPAAGGGIAVTWA
ncbi:MAG: domain containing protein, partial [Phycisphaerales bacterium]|nr:domain containing protein [Phycisphaerales bacterium]